MAKYLDGGGLARLWAKIKATFAPLASPSLTGTPTAPTPPIGTDTQQIATTSFVHDVVDYSATPTDQLLPPGGSSGQVLAKASGTDYDVEWITLTNGDSLAYGVTTQPSAGTARVGATTI